MLKQQQQYNNLLVIAVTLILLISTAAVVIQCSSITSQEDHFLLVMGDVSHDKARILFEDLSTTTTTTTATNHHYSVQLYEHDSINDHDLHLRLDHPLPPSSPLSHINNHYSSSSSDSSSSSNSSSSQRWSPPYHILQLNQLKSNTHYTLTWNHQSFINVTFRTLDVNYNNNNNNNNNNSNHNNKNKNRNEKILVVSCNRLYEDMDDTMIQQMIRDESDRLGMIHLGDQIYADSILKQLLLLSSSSSDTHHSTTSDTSDTTTTAASDNHDNQMIPSLDTVIEMYRHVYRSTWNHPSMKQLMRVGAHWMIPDDHDVFNNLDHESSTVSTTATATTHQTMMMIRDRVRMAGRIAFYEYQYALRLESSLHSTLHVDNNMNRTVNHHVHYIHVNQQQEQEQEAQQENHESNLLSNRAQTDHHDAAPLNNNDTDDDDDNVSSHAYKRVYFSKQMLNTCFLFLDFRFERAYDNDSSLPFLIGQEQFNWLENELNTCSMSNRLTVLLSSTPVLFLSQTMSQLVYAVEKERYSTHRDMLPDTIRLLNMLGQFKINNPNRDIKLVGGDIHQFFQSRICNMSAIPVCLDQMATSGITNGSSVLGEMKLLLFYGVNRYLQPSIHAGSWYLQQQVNQPGLPLQQFLGTNYGVLKFNMANNRKANFFQWYGVARKNITWEEHMIMQLYDQFPTIRPLAILFVMGFVALPVTLVLSCCLRYCKRK